MNDLPQAAWRDSVASSLSGARRIVVCGVGNDLRGDDAAGILCLRSVEKLFKAAGTGRRPVLFLNGGETPENQTSRIRNYRPDMVLLIDAARSGRTPGDIFVIEKELIADDEVSTHRISLSLLVRFIEESIRARVLFLGIEPGGTAPGAPVSPCVRKAVRALSEYLARIF